MRRNVGISGIEKRIAEKHLHVQNTIGAAFDDINKLMDQARDMVKLSKSITEKLRSKQGGEITDDEIVKFKSYLLSLGVADPVTKAAASSTDVYFDKLADEVVQILRQPISECGGTMSLPEAYCRVNRCRGVELISPSDLLNACKRLERRNAPFKLCTFDSGVVVLQLCSEDSKAKTSETAQLVADVKFMDAAQLARKLGISSVLAMERLLAAEAYGKLCRDETIEGLFFYPNRFVDN
ncbi:hypothetical protein M3Y94_00243500 [Aphelenchoides besseyi]|nr:hypothetical protein M3Y94_00243500 [Aphelenchoides besseyi]KAI6236327.1 Vacuolar protein-sorting-associated protein 36 [Aphelenchoides besseyi]